MKYPVNETVWAGYYNRSGDLRYIITSKSARDWYFLYEVVDGAFKKIGKEKEPPMLVKKHGVMEGLNG